MAPKAAPAPKTKIVNPTAPAPIISKRGLFELVNEDHRIIEEELDKLQAAGMSYEDAIEKAVEGVDQLTAKKALSYAGLILSLEAEGDMIDAVAKRNAARAKSKYSKAESLRSRLLMILPRDFTAENEQIKLSFRSNGLRVVDSTVGDVEKLPEALRRLQPAAYSVNKDAAKEHLLKIQADAIAAADVHAPATDNARRDFIKAYIEKHTADLQGMHLVEGFSVSIK